MAEHIIRRGEPNRVDFVIVDGAWGRPSVSDDVQAMIDDAEPVDVPQAVYDAVPEWDVFHPGTRLVESGLTFEQAKGIVDDMPGAFARNRRTVEDYP